MKCRGTSRPCSMNCMVDVLFLLLNRIIKTIKAALVFNLFPSFDSVLLFLKQYSFFMELEEKKNEFAI
ncbi:hypothetical protein MM300_08930 [Evansella sp. LMS18]|uniref:hypothetical protein n=1 Tax=Evansella sp. LMS18 TaxID=2924033 RepID=UPI0020D0E390|nr:hypothetical protein [Evansella sp. LMS18]UTR12392.1 hypothetical protein MM300_08930 [Evansella sp. LMS18]